MEFIDLTGNDALQGDQRQSSLAIHTHSAPRKIVVIGVLPHNYEFLPSTAKDRDRLVAFLNAIEYPEATS